MTRSTPIRSLSPFFSTFVILLFLFSLPGIADARGGRGGGRGGGGFSRGGGGFARSAGGFSRSSAASGGSFSSRAVSRPAPSGERLAGRERPSQPMAEQGGAAERQTQRQESADGRQESRTEGREDWQSHMREQQEERQDWVEDEYWDDHWHHGHYDEGEAFVAGAMIGATAGAVASSSRSTYVTTLPCAASTVIANGVTYYNCDGTWYSRGYEGGSVVYIVSGPP